MLPKLLPAGIEEDVHLSGEPTIERIEGQPVISLERALRFFYKVQEIFPQWKISLHYDSVVDESKHLSYRRYSQHVKGWLGIDATVHVNDMSPQERERYYAYTLQGMPEFHFFERSVPDVDALRQVYPEGSYPRHYLELELQMLRVNVKEALREMYIRAFGPVNHGEPRELLADFRCGFIATTKFMGIKYEPIRLAIATVKDYQVVGVQEFAMGMNTAALGKIDALHLFDELV